MTIDSSAALVDGPWQHRLVAANGARFHVAVTGEEGSPLILFLHAFPQFWWAWRHQLMSFAQAGYRAAAVDLRGFGASDKPPEGYDTPALAVDVESIIRSLGAAEAVIVGHGLGGTIAWSLPALAPSCVKALCTVSVGHPEVMRHHRRCYTSIARRIMWWFQVPWLPERSLTDGDLAVRLMRTWGAADAWLTDEDADRYRKVMQIPFVAHSALEYYRWFGRSAFRIDSRRWQQSIRGPLDIPVLEICGRDDRCLNVERLESSDSYTTGPYRREIVANAGHFVPEEAPEQFDKLLLAWLAELSTDPRSRPQE